MSGDITLFVIFSLAVYRFTELLSSDFGPFEVFLRFRELMGVRYDTMGNPYSHNEIGKALICPFCLSIWVSIPFAVYLATTPLEGLIYATALSGASIIWRRL